MRAHTYDHLMAFALEHPWAIAPAMLPVIAGILARHLAGDPPDDEAIAAALVAKTVRAPYATSSSRSPTSGTLRIPVFGTLAPRMNMLSDVSGGVTFEGLTTQLRQAVADPKVNRIIFDVDSPGGNVAGATEFAKEVRAAAARKPVTVAAAHTLASAAYWVFSGATDIIASASALVGSIGVYTIHDDISEALAKLGVKRSVISAGKYKAEGADGGSLSADARAHMQKLVSDAYGRFVTDVARGRGVSVSAVRTGFGEGRLLSASDALAAGMITRIATIDDVPEPVDVPVANAVYETVARAITEATFARLSAAERRLLH